MCSIAIATAKLVRGLRINLSILWGWIWPFHLCCHSSLTFKGLILITGATSLLPTLLIVVTMLISCWLLFGFRASTDSWDLIKCINRSAKVSLRILNTTSGFYSKQLDSQRPVLKWKHWNSLAESCSWLENKRILTGNFILITALFFFFACGLINDAWLSVQSICCIAARQQSAVTLLRVHFLAWRNHHCCAISILYLLRNINCVTDLHLPEKFEWMKPNCRILF